MNYYTPAERRTQYRKSVLVARMRKMLPIFIIAYVLIVMMMAGTSDYAAGMR